MESTGSTAALDLIHRLLTRLRLRRRRDPRARHAHLLRRSRGSTPTASRCALAERRFIRSSIRIYPREQQDDGLRDADVDGDGRVLDMRIEDPNGAWRSHPDEPRAARPRATGRRRRRRAVLPADARGRDRELRRRHDHGAADASRASTSTATSPRTGRRRASSTAPGRTRPRSRRCARSCEAVDRAAEHRALRRVPHVQRRHPAPVRRPRRRALPDRGPARVPGASASAATEITGYDAVSVFHDFKYDPKTSITGAATSGCTTTSASSRGRPSSGARPRRRA